MERVLIVDDVWGNRELLFDILNSEPNIQIEEACDGFEAISKAQNEPYDIILMDIMMPGINGYQAVEKIKTFENNKNATIIFITADDQEKDTIEKSYELGGIDFISKPIKISELKHLVSLYLRFIRKEKEAHRSLIATNTRLIEEIELRTKAELQFIKSQERFKNIVDKSDAAILIIGFDGLIKFTNNSAEIIFGRKSSELIGEPFGFIAQFDTKSEINIFRKDKTIGTGEITTTQTTWENESAWLVLINDITTHKQLQENLIQAKEKAQESDRLKSAFLSNMSHEIRTPMNGILGFLDFIDKEERIEKRKYYTNIIRTCGNSLLSLINDIIDLSKIEAGHFDLQLDECDIDLICINLYDFFKNNNKFKDKKIDFICNNLVANKRMLIKSDSHRINQILINLLGNAIKFTDHGIISFGYTIQENFLEFFVADTGKGIPKDMLEKVFDRFTQVKNSTAYTQGTGLGLAISKSLVKLLGGEIWVDSEICKGSTFYFTIPMVLFEKDLSVTENTEVEHFRNSGLATKTALIVDDEPFNYELLNDILESEGMKTQWAKNGHEAVEYCKIDIPDIILMDIKMPRLNGLDATKQLRDLNITVPIIAQTAYALDGEKKICLESGCSYYLSKPIMRDELLSVIKKALS